MSEQKENKIAEAIHEAFHGQPSIPENKLDTLIRGINELNKTVKEKQCYPSHTLSGILKAIQELKGKVK